MILQPRPIGSLVPDARAKALLADILAGRLKPSAESLNGAAGVGQKPQDVRPTFLSYDPESLELVFTGSKMTWLEARKFAEQFGGLPSHALLDYVINSHQFDHPRDGFAVWANELLVYNRPGHVFTGADIVDAASNAIDKRPWIIPGSSLPAAALNDPRIGLFIVPGEITESNDRVVILPLKVIVLRGFIDASRTGTGSGLIEVGSEHRIPIQIYPNDSFGYERREIELAINSAEGASYTRPLYKNVGVNTLDQATNRNTVCAAGRLGITLEVAYVKG